MSIRARHRESSGYLRVKGSISDFETSLFGV
jgi:hypothetical protein